MAPRWQWLTLTSAPTSKLAVGFGGAGAANAGLQTFLPAVYKKGVCDGGFNWPKFSIIRIQNPTSNNATNVDIYYYNPNGSPGSPGVGPHNRCRYSIDSPHPC